MPRQIDREERIAEIHDAVLRLIVRSGVSAASLRNVAEESGINIGSVRHYVGSHAEMLRGAARRMWTGTAVRLTTRLQQHDPQEDPEARREFAVDLLEELVPLDERRRDETTVWLSLLDYGRVDPEIGALAREASGGIRQLAEEMLQAAGVRASAPVDALAAAVDGLAIATLSNPAHYTRRRVRAALRWQVEQAVRSGRN